MNKKYSAIPFLILLTIIIILVVWSDNYAENLSNIPRIVHLDGGQNSGSDMSLWQFEIESDSSAGDALLKDSTYVAAIRAYGQESWIMSQLYFESVLNSSGPSVGVYNYLGLIGLKTNELSDAIQNFNRALSLDDNYNPARLNLALIYSRLENYTAADSIYVDLTRRNPFNSRARINHGIMLCRIGEWARAKLVLDGAVEVASGKQKAKALAYRGMTHINLTDTLTGQQDFQSAINLAPDYILPRVYLALVAPTDNESLDEINKVIRLKESYAPAHYYKGVILERQGLSQEARLSFEKALELNPSDAELSALLGAFYINNDLITEAEQFFRLVYGEDTIAPQSLFYQAKIASRKDDVNAAIDLYRKAIQTSGNNYAEAYHNLGVLLKRTSKTEEAIAAYKSAIKLRPNYESAWYNLGLAYRAQANNSDAIAAYEKAIVINPLATKSMYNLALLYSDLNQDAQAMNLWEKIIDVDPDYAKAWYNLGLNHQKKGRYQESIDIYAQMLERFPNYAKAWYNKAIALKELGLYEEAISAYELAIEHEPAFLAAWKNLGALEARQGNIDRAAEVFAQAVDLDPSDPEMRYNLALQLNAQGEPREAAIQLNKAINMRPEYLKAVELLSQIAKDLNDDKLEIKTREYLAGINNNPEDWYDLARDLHKLKQFNAAIQRYEKAETLGKSDEWVAYWRGKAHEELDEIIEAQKWYETALKRNGKHKFSLYRLAIVYEESNPSRSAELKRKLVQYYPEFAREKEIEL